VAVKKPEIDKYEAPLVVQEEIEEPEEVVIEEEVEEVINVVEDVEDSEDIESSEGVETDVPAEPDFDINPGFPGGGGSFMDWLERNLKYPAAAKRMGIEGTVIVEFTVDENGKISDAAIFESLHRLCDREALRLIKIMPVWVPGIKNGIKVRGKHTLEIPFVIK
jgi:protein TonB